MEFKNLSWTIVGIIGGIFWIFYYWDVLKRPSIYLPSKYVKRGYFSIFKLISFLVGIVGWGYLSYSLAQPRLPLGYAENKVKVNDIFFVVDVSRSMLANDFEPNRLEAAKEKIIDFVKLRPTDRIGIIMFAEKVFTLLPLSTDLDLISQIVSEIQIGFLGNGTNIGDALGLAVARAAQSLAENKIIILLTDGVSNVGNMTPIQSAEKAADQNVKVYTIGIGGARDAKIPVGNSRFSKRYQYIPGGSIDLATLEKIAKITGGKDYLAQDPAALAEVLKTISQLEKTEIKTSGKVVYKELYYKYLFIGILLLFLAEVSKKIILKEVE